jgi:MFS family permease
LAEPSGSHFLHPYARSCLVSFGRLGDAIGLKPVYLAGLTIFTLASGLIAFPAPVTVMIALRGVQGAGAAMVSATSLALLARGRLFREYSQAIGWQTAMTYAGLALGPLFLGLALQRFGGRTIFLLHSLPG